MKLLQIGDENWAKDLELPEQIEWLYTPSDKLQDYLEGLKVAEIAKIPEERLAEMEEPPKVHIHFSGVVVTSDISEEVLEQLTSNVDAYSLFKDKGVTIFDQQVDGICRRAVMRELPIEESHYDTILYLYRNLFGGQYGAKLKIPEIDVNPHFKGQVSYDGNVGVNFEGDFGKDFTTLYTFRYNLPVFSMSLELWPEFIKEGDCQLRMEIVCLRKGSLGDVYKTLIIDECDLKEPYILRTDEEVGHYSISFSVKGSGKLKFGVTHWRYSREGLGRFVLGGKRHVDEKRQEIFTYFNPGDLKPPLNVYFSGFRGAEGFEGFFMMKAMRTPFMLIADPRLEGGCFYSGTEQLEKNVIDAIQESLDYLGFTSDQLILSGLSMGAFGGLYYASHFKPHAVIVGKPFTNLGDTVANLKLKRPDEFETSGDMIRNVVGGSDEAAIERFNQHFWNKFGKVDFDKTEFAIAYMQQDDYDGHAMERLVEHLADSDTHIYAKGYEGRHNDNSRAINRWFMTQYHKFLKNDFGRKL
ncbi:accessory Sec system protein Asp2 [Streptococcus suis]|uniref:accessory Sec system protein Asp2 n=1 Tax=Streptococcus suis TaxID=1307 RepID=UPI0011465BFF|nr:accessory Sec system protein Asp2 [Streptococcus suis]TQE45502.1 accessory Sec system protein Asp2 [Streptococcus suis]